MPPKKPARSRPATRQSEARRSRSSGFGSMDPSNMGFDMPEWVGTPATERPSDEGGPTSGRARETSMAPETRSVIEGMKVVCICKGIKKRVFWNALDAGICTREDINRHTGSGSGSCQGRRCGPRILDMLKRIR